MKSSKRQLVIPAVIFLIALAAQVSIIAVMPNLGNSPRMDSVGAYEKIARNVLAGKGFSINGIEPATLVGPGYPGFLALAYSIFGEGNRLAVKLLQAVIGAFTAVLVLQLSRLLFSARIALVASLIVAAHPEIAGLSSFLYSETIFTFLLTAGVLLIVLAVRRNDLRIFLASGFVLGLAALFRGILLPLPAFLFLGYLITRTKWQKALGWTAVFAVGMGISVLPWVIRNYAVTHRFIPVAEIGGAALCQGNYLPFDGRFRYEESGAMIDKIAGKVSLPEIDRKLRDYAIREMREHPWPTAWLMVRKVGRFWFELYENVPTGKKRTPNKLIVLVLGGLHYPLLLLAAIGLIRIRKPTSELSVFYVLLVFFTIVHAITLTVPRYRLPVMPLVCIFAAVGACQVWDWVMRRARGRHTQEPDSTKQSIRATQTTRAK